MCIGLCLYLLHAGDRQSILMKMESFMQIRKAKKEDIEEIMEIFSGARIFMAATGNPHQWGEQAWPPRDLILQDIKEEKSYLCFDEDGKVLGSFFYDFGIDVEPDYEQIEEGSWERDIAYGVVHRIAVRNQTKGVGTFCLNWAYKQCKLLRIDTHEDNKVMQNLLNKLGFVAKGKVYVGPKKEERIAFEK